MGGPGVSGCSGIKEGERGVCEDGITHLRERRDAWHFKKLLLLVTMIFPKEDPPKQREYCMERKNLGGFLKRIEKKGIYFLSINP